MLISIYARDISSIKSGVVLEMCLKIVERGGSIAVCHSISDVIKGYIPHDLFDCYENFNKRSDLLVTVGGDGAFLNGFEFTRDSGVPIIGVNTGRLGFLADVSIEEIDNFLDKIFNGCFSVQERIVLSVNDTPFNDFSYAINDFTILKQDSAQMIELLISIDGDYVSTFLADGVIVATPTGSTAYSLSVGGPIVSPQGGAFIINLIAPHHLTVRPLVISDRSEITIKVTGRDPRCMISLDSRSKAIPVGGEFTIKLANFRMNRVVLDGTSFYATLRKKLMWGLDSRNI